MFFILYKEFHRLFGLYTHLLMINYELGGLVVAKGGRGEFPPVDSAVLSQGGTTPRSDSAQCCLASLIWQALAYSARDNWCHAEYAIIIRSPQQGPNSLVWVPEKYCQQTKDITVLRGPCNTSNSVEWVQCCSIDVLFTDKFLKKTNKRDINECNAYFSRSPSAQLLTFPLSWGCADSNDLPSLPFVLLSLVHLCYQYVMCVMLIWLC